QKRRRLIDSSFRPCFYVQGRERQLARLAEELPARAAVSCALTERQNIWDRRPLRVLQVSVHHPTLFAPLARFVRRLDGSLTLYDSDLMLASMYCWEKNVFPLARVEIEVGPSGAGSGPNAVRPYITPEIHSITCRDDEWRTGYERPPVRTMRMRLEGISDVNPKHGRHGAIEVAVENDWQTLDDSDEPTAQVFERLLRGHDPDVLVTEWGDDVLLPGLLRQAQRLHIRLSLNRDALPVERTRSRSYMSYGRILFKESTTTLFGRLHIDTQNSFAADQCEMEGLWELVRVTKLPVQYACRTTPGTGISYLQMEVAWRDGVLIPAQKAEPESLKHPDELLQADRGGLVFPPRLGFFENVAELDFVSEFPSIMAKFNISPETINCPCCPQAPRVPELGYRVCQKHRGITSRVVERLIAKRRQYKELREAGLAVRDPGLGAGLPIANCRLPMGRGSGSGIWNSEFEMGKGRLVAQPAPSAPDCVSRVPNPEPQVPDPSSIINRQSAIGNPAPSPVSQTPSPAACKQRRDVLKWLLVCCFGYTGYKNARFGKIEAHEAINALAREKLLVAKEAAEQRGFRVLHALVDSIYVQKSGASPLPIADCRLPNEPIDRRQSKDGNGEEAETRKSKFETRGAATEFRVSHFDFRPSIENRQSKIGNCEGSSRTDYERLALEIEQITGLPLALEAVYRFAVFLPSRQCAEIPVPNRFFCVSEEGKLKVRGLECRRHDTPPFVTRMQREVLAILAEARDFFTYCDKLREAREVYERYQERLRDGSVAVEELVIRKRLTQAPASYQKNSSTAIAARQLDRAGVKLRPGENIEFIITDANSSLIDDRVRAWTLWEGWRGYDVEAYGKALEKAFEPAAHFGSTVPARVTGSGRTHPP
ncbi:MAG TPA: DNA polymerase domain-containing protein, partial [Terriglobia bacterium]|nr:DNA polymerase domain-containing protein [Terriglobia bacterium]